MSNYAVARAAAGVPLLVLLANLPVFAATAIDDTKLITSAEAAAPAALATHATIVTIDPQGKMRKLRKGTNGFTCMPDDPTSPGPDPMCMDANAMAWVEALIVHKPPPKNRPGIMYMLAGGSDASNTDPYAAGPKADNHWIATGPHVMLVGSETSLKGYPHAADPNTAEPYVMWAGTPYAHLMLPVH